MPPRHIPCQRYHNLTVTRHWFDIYPTFIFTERSDRMPLCRIHFHDKKSTSPILLLLQCWSPPFLQSWSLVMRYSIIILFALLNASLTNALPLQRRCVVPVFDSCNCLTPLAGLTPTIAERVPLGE